MGSRDGFIYSASFGNFTYGDPAPISRSNPPMTNEVNITCSAVASVQTRTSPDFSLSIVRPCLFDLMLLGQEPGVNEVGGSL